MSGKSVIRRGSKSYFPTVVLYGTESNNKPKLIKDYPESFTHNTQLCGPRNSTWNFRVLRATLLLRLA